jgi:hypothetical protein
VGKKIKGLRVINQGTKVLAKNTARVTSSPKKTTLVSKVMKLGTTQRLEFLG